ncbi:MAG: AMP-binding protein, partial [Gammaproteobacteria bacterium]
QVQQFIWLPSEDPTEPVEGMHRFDDLAACGDPLPTVHVQSSDLAQIVYTSGTESMPKGAMLTHDAVLWQYVSCVINAEIAEQDRTLHALPLYHCAQLDVFFGPAIYIGSSNVITGKPTPDHLLALLEQHQITSFFAPPTVWIALLRSPLFDAGKLAHLAKGYYGASIMPVEVLKELAARLPRVRLWNLYGQTEIAPLATMLAPEDQLRKPGSCGKAVLNVETRVVNDDMQDVAPGEVGEIVHRSPHLMLGYFNDPERTAAAFAGGWFHSGDLAVQYADGYFKIKDRSKDIIISGGENISSIEVEDVLYRHPDVLAAAVVARPDPKWGETPCAFVELKLGAQTRPEDIVAHCKQHLAGFKVPRYVVFGELPKTSTGKIQKFELRKRAGSASAIDV